MIQLFGHPFSCDTWKAEIAFYGHDNPVRVPDGKSRATREQRRTRAPVGDGQVPAARRRRSVSVEATTIIEYFEAVHTGWVKMIPDSPEAAVRVRTMDPVFGNYAMNVMTVIVGNALRPEEHRDPYGVERAHGNLDRIYAWLDGELGGRDWACGADFTLADCAAAPSLFYADRVHPVAEQHATLKTYRGRLMTCPSVARCVDNARPYRAYFPPGAPDRD